jgi:hypothetical protein
VFHPEQASHKSSRLNEGNYDESFGTPSDGDSNDDPSMFFELMSPDSSTKPDQMSASALAYLGDVLFELFIRSRYVWPNRRMSDLQNKVVSIVRGECWICIARLVRVVFHVCISTSISSFSRGTINAIAKVS